MLHDMKKVIILILSLALVLPATANRPKIGLALGGGGAKGAAEVGVLKVLEEAGIKVDYIAGTSIGAIVGGLYASGYSAQELEVMFQTQEWLSLLTDRNAALSNEPYKTVDGITYIFGFPIMDRKHSGFGMMRGGKIEQLLDSMTAVKGCKNFEDLKTPFCCVAADIRTAEEVVLKNGTMAKAMRASMAIPGIFKPVERGDWMLVDGGLINNLPVDVCRQMGADIVIAVDLQQNEQVPRKKNDTSLLNGIASMLGFGGIVDWITSRPDINRYNENKQKADIYIHPDIENADAVSFGNKKAARMIQDGITAAKKHLAELRRLSSSN